jgi:hypothetical protein
MQGLYLNYSRPASKKAIKDSVAAHGISAPIGIEATSLFGNEYDGPLSDAPVGSYHFVGPDPYTSRKFYGTLTVTAEGTVTVK